MDDYPNDPLNGTFLSTSGTLSGTIDSVLDEDYFRVSLLAGETIEIDLVPDFSGGDPLEYADLVIIDRTSVLLGELATDIDADVEFSIEENDTLNISFTATKGGSYIIGVLPGEPFFGDLPSTGDYTLSVQLDAPKIDDYDDLIVHSAVIDQTTTINGFIHNSDDNDVFQFTVGTRSGFHHGPGRRRTRPIGDDGFH